MFPVMFPQEIAQDASKILLERLEEQPTHVEHHSHVEVARYTLHSYPLAPDSTTQLLSTWSHLTMRPPLQQARLRLSYFGYRSLGLGAWTPI